MRTIPLVTFEMHMREGARHSSTRGAKKESVGRTGRLRLLGAVLSSQGQASENLKASENLNCQHRQIMSYVLSKIR